MVRLVAAMEPAVERREHWLEAYDQPPTILPQWSPPLDGGSTRAPDHAVLIRMIAAMEPAAERREHQRGLERVEDVEVAAAMEPAAERREHTLYGIQGTARAPLPQWSPPLNGGSTTWTGIPAAAQRRQPQWSPPLNGGSTARSFEAV